MRKITLLVGLLVAALILVSCVPATLTPTADQVPDQIATSVAQTVIAEATLSTGKTAVAMLTEIASQPTSMPQMPTVLPSATQSPPTATPQPTPTALRCNWAAFVADMGVVDNTVLTPGTVFTKIWRIRNIGACTWNTSYSFVFRGGDALSAPQAVGLPYAVGPGGTVDISLQLVSPATPGSYVGQWLLLSDQGELFGQGANAQDTFQTQIVVAGLPGTGGYAYDFTASYCSADWRSEIAGLNCPGTLNDTNGFVVLINQPYLESRQATQAALWTRPHAVSNGWIIGEYPEYTVNDGDVFVTEVGCLQDSPACDVVFYLDYRLLDGTVNNLGSWRERYDGRTTSIQMDISSLRGETIQLILSVRNRGAPEDANAFWLAPHIENNAYRNDLVLKWHSTGGSKSVCQELNIYLIGGGRTAQARAYSCKGTTTLIGTRQLNADELDQLLTWYDQFNYFDGEVFTAGNGDPVTSYLTFNGNGSQDASSNNIQSMQNLAEYLFAAINK